MYDFWRNYFCQCKFHTKPLLQWQRLIHSKLSPSATWLSKGCRAAIPIPSSPTMRRFSAKSVTITKITTSALRATRRGRKPSPVCSEATLVPLTSSWIGRMANLRLGIIFPSNQSWLLQLNQYGYVL